MKGKSNYILVFLCFAVYSSRIGIAQNFKQQLYNSKANSGKPVSLQSTIMGGLLTSAPSGFFDDFEDGVADGWAPQDANRWEVIVDEGDLSYHLRTPHPTGDEFSLIADRTFSDFDMSIQVKSGDISELNLFILFDLQTYPNGYYLHLGQFATVLYLTTGGPGTGVEIDRNDNYKITNQQYHTIRIVRNGTNIKVFGDGVQILNLVEGTFLSGQIGIGSFRGTAFFDDVDIIEFGSIPTAPTLLSPADGATGISVNPTLSWNVASGATSYQLQVSTTSSFSTTVINQSGITQTTYLVSGLFNNTTYYWRVNATNTAGTSNWSSVRSFTTIVAAPVAPMLGSPADGATGISVNPTLSWNAASGAMSYRVQVSTSSSFSTTVVDRSGITQTTFPISGLLNNTTYYWRVNATNAGGTSDWSSVRSFTTNVAVPAAPTLVSPADGATGISVNPTLSWNVASGAMSYRLQVSTTSNFSTTVFDQSGITQTTFPISGLLNNTTYYWRVNATNAGGTSNWSSVRSFTTIVTVPAAPTLGSPADGATGISDNPTLSWNVASGATSYRVQVSTSSSFSTTVVDQSGLAQTSYLVSGLLNNTTYYWRVNATNAGGTSNWSSVRSFTTIVAAPVAPMLVSPADGATGISVNPTLSWNVASGATSYRLQASTISNFSTTVVDQGGLTQTSFPVSGLLNNTTYYWRVNATNAGGTSDWSSVRSFTTIVAVPAAPTLVSPADGATGISVNPTLNWNVAGGATSYRVQVSTSSSFSTTVVDQSGLAQISYLVSGLLNNTTYYWRVNATNAGGTSDWSSVRSFTTNVPPLPPALSSPSANAFTNNNTPTLIFNVPHDVDGDQLHFRVEIDDDGNWGSGTITYESRFNASGFNPAPPVPQGVGQVIYTVQSTLTEGDWWWRVSAWDGQVYGGSSTERKLIVDVTKPFTSNHNPSKGAASVPINVNIVVHVKDAASGVKQSSIVMKVNGNIVFPSIIGNSSDYTLTYDPLIDFGYEQTINVSIDAADSSGNAMTTDLYSFNTASQTNTAPSTPTLTLPSANAFTNDNTPTLTFNVPTDENGDQLHFKVEIDDDGSFGTGTQAYESKSSTVGFSPTPPVVPGSGQVTYTVQVALAEGDWWWRVSAWDSKVYGSSSDERKFVVDVTKPFTSNHSPSKGATDVAINANLVFHIQDALSGVKKSSIVMKVNDSAVSFTITGTSSDYTLIYDPPIDFGYQQAINVSIDAADSAGNAMTTDSYTFTTARQGVNTAPNAPTLLSPSDNAFTNDNTPNLIFNVPQDDNGDQLHFKVEIDDDGSFGAGTQTFESKSNSNGFSPTPPVVQGSGQVTYTVQSTLAEGEWWWQVTAWDGRVYGDSSVARRFIVDQSPPQITHFPVILATSGQSQTIPATITDNFGIQSVLLYYRKGGASVYTTTAMSNISGAAYQGIIPGSEVTERGMEYYFSVEDSAKNTRTFPVTNPSGKPQVIQVTNSNLAFPNPTPIKAYRIISIPFDLDDKKASSVIGDDFLGKYDSTQWRMSRYVNGVNLEFDRPDFNSVAGLFAPGVGFWLITKEAENLDAGAGRSVTTAQNFVITLPAGWSQIGNPFAFTVNWSDVIKGAEVENKLWGYQGTLNEATGYDINRTQLVPFEGYFVNNKGSSPTTIEIPPKEATAEAAAKPVADWKSALQSNEWTLQITATSGRYLDKDNYLGCFDNAADEWDTNDFSEAPFFADHISLYFPHPEWPKYPDLYTGDFREVKSEGDYWDFVVKSEVAKSEVGRSEVVLKLAEVQNLAADWQIILLDKASRVSVNFGEGKQYTFLPEAGKAAREFRVVVGQKDFVESNDLRSSGVPQDFMLGQNYPNPFSANGTLGNPETRINYELPATSHVKIAVYNLSGQFIRALFDNEQSGGRYTVAWDGNSTNGNRVASGVYLVRMEAGNFLAVKKMILTK